MRRRLCAVVFAALIPLIGFPPILGNSPQIQQPAKKRIEMTTAKGTFDVKITPLQPHDKTDGPFPGRMFIDKQFHGDLEGSGKGEMLAVMNETRDSGTYVALERVRGTLQGKQGTFVFHHRGIMDHGSQDLQISVVPGSGTGELKGLAGEFKLKVVEGKHLYEFNYSLPQ